MKLEDISYKEYFEMPDKSEYDFAFKYGTFLHESENKLGLPDLNDWPFGVIKDLQFYCSTELSLAQLFEEMAKVKGIDIERFVELPISHIFRTKYWVLDELRKLTEIENEALKTVITSEEQQAGLELFDHLGVYLQIRSIAKELNLTIQQVRDMQYKDGFIELITQRALNQYQKNYMQIINKKHNFA